MPLPNRPFTSDGVRLHHRSRVPEKVSKCRSLSAMPRGRLRTKAQLARDMYIAYTRASRKFKSAIAADAALMMTQVCVPTRLRDGNFNFWTHLRPPFIIQEVLQTDHGECGEIFEVTYGCALDYKSERSWGWPHRAASTFDNRIRSKATIRIPQAYPCGCETIKVLHWGNPCLVGYNDHEVEVIEEKGIINKDLVTALRREIDQEHRKSLKALEQAFGGGRKALADLALPRAPRLPGKAFGKSVKGQMRPRRVLRVGRGRSILEEGLGDAVACDKALSADRQSMRREVHLPEYLLEKVERLKREFDIGDPSYRTSQRDLNDPIRAPMVRRVMNVVQPSKAMKSLMAVKSEMIVAKRTESNPTIGMVLAFVNGVMVLFYGEDLQFLKYLYLMGKVEMEDTSKSPQQGGVTHDTSVFKGSDGCELFLRRWTTECSVPSGGGDAMAVFLVHGMGEHSQRYHELASNLLTALPPGSVVYCHDQRGHGQTAVGPGGRLSALGRVPCEEGADPMSVMADDVVCLVMDKLPHTGMNYVLLSHSMGSVVVRLALARLMQLSDIRNPSGVLLSGPPAAPGRLLNAVYQCLLWLVRPTNFGPSLASKIIFGGYDSQIRALVKDPNLPQHSWLSTDEDTVRRYTEDPLCGHDVSIDFWSSLLSNLSKLTDCRAVFGPKPASRDLVKVLVMGGADDMCTERGKGVDQVLIVADRKCS
ncbi:hypothetical protein FOL46_008676 [Perkinsus olseni]|uniref:Serine aminopeptidase S33 domain-containing protein n=1 Tax=Perkinsus olseni TaxID=32597 RepID=A0A7J6L5V2_PEROL|nr:hypothetical protein FOL46_008676 [Perkinsus olseni]